MTFHYFLFKKGVVRFIMLIEYSELFFIYSLMAVSCFGVYKLFLKLIDNYPNKNIWLFIKPFMRIIAAVSYAGYIFGSALLFIYILKYIFKL